MAATRIALYTVTPDDDGTLLGQIGGRYQGLVVAGAARSAPSAIFATAG